jgi:hypothetical protein
VSVVAGILQVTPQHIRNLIRDDVLAGYRFFGARNYIVGNDLQALLAMGVLPREHSPRFADWAAAYCSFLKRQGRIARLELIEVRLVLALRFWGGKPSGRNPKNQPVVGEPYHDARLIDPILAPQMIRDFEVWMVSRGLRSRARKNLMGQMRDL